MTDDPLSRAQQSIALLRAGLAEALAERDAARREVCSLEADTIDDQREYAAQRGWTDLFPVVEQSDHACPQVPTVRSKESDE